MTGTTPITDSRRRVTHEEMAALQPAAGWDDGRTGFIWCRFEALVSDVDDSRNLRAEVTWDDNDAEPPANRMYYAPQLRFETNDRSADGALWTRDEVALPITNAEAVRIVSSPPRDLLTTYADEISKLK